ncbi:hypothetical protein M6B38_230550 [Iris pallida]|uniref:Uncharacterized protein n=1 Tax=Iris pallida TaxID=29817 RepID=A0AAX6DS95_IRIPA|nr:hypothetical protein M6B38_230545 [Iris pallida]KAJ6794555.1 hypothetical protein M6B38_230550 [Iris pallida]
MHFSILQFLSCHISLPASYVHVSDIFLIYVHVHYFFIQYITVTPCTGPSSIALS